MKKCSYCGKEYSDDVLYCVIDGEPLPNGEAADSATLPLPESAPAISVPARVLSERQMRITEVVLVCLIAFGPALIASTGIYIYGSTRRLDYHATDWIANCLAELSALALVWYVLARHKKSFADLGLKWKWGDLGSAVILIITGSLAYYGVYCAIYVSGLAPPGDLAAGERAGEIVFASSISLTTVMLGVLNPFFEELIARAYFMTEIKLLTNSIAKAVIASTLLQTSYHLYQGLTCATANGAMFLIFSIFYAKTGRLTPIILAHLYFDIGAILWYWARQ